MAQCENNWFFHTKRNQNRGRTKELTKVLLSVRWKGGHLHRNGELLSSRPLKQEPRAHLTHPRCTLRVLITFPNVVWLGSQPDPLCGRLTG